MLGHDERLPFTRPPDNFDLRTLGANAGTSSEAPNHKQTGLRSFSRTSITGPRLQPIEALIGGGKVTIEGRIQC